MDHEAVPQDSPRSSESTRRRVYEDTWTSCTGLKTDRRLLEYSVKSVVGLGVLGFSMVELSMAGECDSLISFWCSLISLIVGVFVAGGKGKKDAE